MNKDVFIYLIKIYYTSYYLGMLYIEYIIIIC